MRALCTSAIALRASFAIFHWETRGKRDNMRYPRHLHLERLGSLVGSLATCEVGQRDVETEILHWQPKTA